MSKKVIESVMKTLGFQYMSEKAEFNSLSRESQLDIIIDHINERMVDIVHTLAEVSGNAKAVETWVDQAVAITEADLVMRNVHPVQDCRSEYLLEYHPRSESSEPKTPAPTDTPKELINDLIVMGLQSKSRNMVIRAIKLNEEHKILTEEEVDGLLAMHWDWGMVEVGTNENWEEFCSTFGGTSGSGPTIDEWQPQQVSDECPNLDGYIALPKYLVNDNMPSSLLSWGDELHKWLNTLDMEVKQWLDDQPEILSYEELFVSTIPIESCDEGEVQIKITVRPKISLAELILLEKDQ